MGFLSKLLGITDPVEALKGLESAIKILRMSVFSYLLKNVYTPKFGSDEANLWAISVLNTMIVAPPGNEKANNFYNKNEDQIWQEALQIKKLPELSGTSGGASYLYFAEIFFATAMKNKPHLGQAKKSEYASRIMELEERGAQLGVFLPTTKNMRNSNDPIYIIDRICTFANEFIKKNVAG